MPEQLTEQTLEAVLEALGRSEFKWRTVPGVARETGLEPETVRQALLVAADKVVRSSVPSTEGHDLYTTRDHLRESASLPEKMLGAMKNRAI